MNETKVGVWLIGALGSVATTVFLGALALKKELIPATGMVTEIDAFRDLDLVGMNSLELGGCDVRRGSLRDAADHLCVETGAIDRGLVDEIRDDLLQVERNIGMGTTRNCGEAIQGLTCFPAVQNNSLRDEIGEIRKCLQRFKRERLLRDAVVVNLASTEPPMDIMDCHKNLDAFEAALDRDDPESVRASTLYAYAAVREGCPYINFTPSNAALIPAIVELAQKSGIPVMGNDGKTGETLVKSALAPMFLCRNLEILSWEGFNILGNMDGRVLDHPDNKESKIKTKDRVLSNILGYTPHSGVHIHYVPSLDDQKTAWDFIHFKGFMGAKMSLQFTWQGYDSLLAAPLVLDLVRFAEFAKRRGEAGLMPHLATFFKAPVGVDEHRLYEQFRMLSDYADKARNKPRSLNPVAFRSRS